MGMGRFRLATGAWAGGWCDPLVGVTEVTYGTGNGQRRYGEDKGGWLATMLVYHIAGDDGLEERWKAMDMALYGDRISTLINV